MDYWGDEVVGDGVACLEKKLGILFRGKRACGFFFRV